MTDAVTGTKESLATLGYALFAVQLRGGLDVITTAQPPAWDFAILTPDLSEWDNPGPATATDTPVEVRDDAGPSPVHDDVPVVDGDPDRLTGTSDEALAPASTQPQITPDADPVSSALNGSPNTFSPDTFAVVAPAPVPSPVPAPAPASAVPVMPLEASWQPEPLPHEIADRAADESDNSVEDSTPQRSTVEMLRDLSFLD